MELDNIRNTVASSYYAVQQQQQNQQNATVRQPVETGTVKESPTEAATSNITPAAASDRVQVTSSVTLKNVDTIRAIEQMHSRMNQQIKAVRETNETLNKETVQIEQMTTTLDSIMKNFPPFPISSKERQEILMSYTSLRQEILKMMVPQPPGPVYEKVKDTWKTLFTDNGQLQPSAVPALQTDGSDAAVKTTAAQLGATGQAMASLSSSITQTLFQG